MAGTNVTVWAQPACFDAPLDEKNRQQRFKHMALKQQLTDDMKMALRQGDKHALGVIRLVLAAIKQHEVDERIKLSDAQVCAVLEKMLKQREGAIQQYENAKRHDLATAERNEMDIIERYLPKKLDEDALESLINTVIHTTGASQARDMGKVIAAMKEQADGRLDMAVVSAKVKAHLATWIKQ